MTEPTPSRTYSALVLTAVALQWFLFAWWSLADAEIRAWQWIVGGLAGTFAAGFLLAAVVAIWPGKSPDDSKGAGEERAIRISSTDLFGGIASVVITTLPMIFFPPILDISWTPRHPPKPIIYLVPVILGVATGVLSTWYSFRHELTPGAPRIVTYIGFAFIASAMLAFSFCYWSEWGIAQSLAWSGHPPRWQPEP